MFSESSGTNGLGIKLKFFEIFKLKENLMQQSLFEEYFSLLTYDTSYLYSRIFNALMHECKLFEIQDEEL